VLTEAARALVGDQFPRIECVPSGEFREVSTAGPAAVALSKMAGLILDPWQAYCMDRLLGQNGKGAILEALELAWLFLLGAKTICHSAHEFATSKNHFERIESLISGTPELKGELARGGVKFSHGEESLKLVNGQKLVFKTRTKGAGRGFSFDKIVLDEAMILKAEGVKALTFTSSARPDPQLVFAGSAGGKDSVHFGRVRSRGMNKTDPRLFLAEWSAELCSMFCERGTFGEFICQVHDNRANPATWAKANPGIGIRLQMENVHSEFGGLEAADFDMERLSVGDWPVDDSSWSVITEEGWLNCLDPVSSAQRPMTFSIDTTPDKRYSAICVAADNGEGSTHIEVTAREGVADYRPGTSWVVPRAIEINKRIGRSAQWIIDKGTQAGAHWEELSAAGLDLVTPTTREYAQACGEFFASVMPIGGSKPSIRHIGQPELSAAVAGAEKRDLAEMWAWDKRKSATDVSTLVAATNAVWGHRKRMNKPKPKPAAAWG